MFKSMKVKLTGISPMLEHSGRLANPLDACARRMKAISAKRNKQPEDYEALARAEFSGGLYLSRDGKYIIPGHNIEACLLEGAKRIKLGRQSQSGVFVIGDPLLKFKGSDKKPDALWKGGQHALMVSVRVQQSRVMRTRPMIPEGWSCTVELKYDPAIIEDEAIMRAFEVAGLERGLGDWRPKFGRFSAKRV